TRAALRVPARSPPVRWAACVSRSWTETARSARSASRRWASASSRRKKRSASSRSGASSCTERRSRARAPPCHVDGGGDPLRRTTAPPVRDARAVRVDRAGGGRRGLLEGRQLLRVACRHGLVAGRLQLSQEGGSGLESEVWPRLERDLDDPGELPCLA